MVGEVENVPIVFPLRFVFTVMQCRMGRDGDSTY